MLGRLGNVLGWTGNAIAVLCLLGTLMNRINGGDPSALVLFGFVGVPAFLIGQALRYILRDA